MQVTEFVWDEAKQCKVPVVRETTIAELNNSEATAVAEVKAAEVTVTAVATQAIADAKAIDVNTADAAKVEAAKKLLLDAKRALAIAQGKTPGKKGKPKLYNYKRVMLGAQVSEETLNAVKAFMPTGNATTIVNAALDALLANFEAQAEHDAAIEAAKAEAVSETATVVEQA